MNPLLSTAPLPLFDQILPEHVAPAIETLLAKASEALETVTAPAFPAQWEAIARELDVATEKLGIAWGAVSHLKSVADTPELRAAYNAMLPAVTDFWTRLGADERLFAKYKAIDVQTLNTEQRQAHKNAIRNFVLGGADLAGAERERFAAIQDQQAALGQKFSENTLDATDTFSYYATATRWLGYPRTYSKQHKLLHKPKAKRATNSRSRCPATCPSCSSPTAVSCAPRMYRAFVTRASDQADAATQKYDNTQGIREILSLRQEEAALLGYPNFGSLSLVPKMASSPEAVISFLRDLGAKARPFAEQDLADMRAFAREHLQLADPQAWDWPYVGEKLKEARYAFSEQEVKQYFTFPKVLAGLFKIAETLFDLVITRDQAPVWNANVEFYRIERAGPQGTHLVGQFYLDPTSRNGKRGGAWMDEVVTRWLRPDTQQVQTPVAQLVCNFADGVEVDGRQQPALLSHDDVITLFHEFGHGLHHMLTQVNEHDVSGISGVEWDAVELPSQFMENFCWEWNVLRHMTSHVQTGEPLPRALFDKMVAARNFQSGLQTLRQIEFALFDMLLHTATTRKTIFCHC
jgi:oligopeptidase A